MLCHQHLKYDRESKNLQKKIYRLHTPLGFVVKCYSVVVVLRANGCQLSEYTQYGLTNATVSHDPIFWFLANISR
jgi:hypothetical protein